VKTTCLQTGIAVDACLDRMVRRNKAWHKKQKRERRARETAERKPRVDPLSLRVRAFVAANQNSVDILGAALSEFRGENMVRVVRTLREIGAIQ
jgi:hypothetical protein